MSPMERVRWAREVVRLRAEGKTWPEVAKITGMSQAKCKRLERDIRDHGDPDSVVDPMAPVLRHLDVLEVTMDEASATYLAASPGSTARVGALKLLKESSAEMLEMMQLIGAVPRSLAAFRAEREMQQMLRDFIEVVRDHDIPDEAVQAMRDLAARRLAVGRPLLAPAT